jgi:formate hydrogenlyase subunit 6/NADH:ubiquinone oxidoreductase subunit I
MGRGDFRHSGPLRIGMAFVDRGRCLPWAMDRPCIVCQENCPVSPKAIFTREEYRTLRDGTAQVRSVAGRRVILENRRLKPGVHATGDVFVVGNRMAAPVLVRDNDATSLHLAAAPVSRVLRPGDEVRLAVRLQLPYVDPARCIGCGVCEHECPVQGRRAVRVTAENESRQPRHRMLTGGMSGS